MTIREHLIYHLQDLYSFEWDFLALMQQMIQQGVNQELRETLERRHAEMREELEVLERALNLLGARYKMERSSLAPALHESLQRFVRQQQPSREQQDLFALMKTQAVYAMLKGVYQADIELAAAAGEQDLVTLLRENVQRQDRGANELQAILSPLIHDAHRDEFLRAA